MFERKSCETSRIQPGVQKRRGGNLLEIGSWYQKIFGSYVVLAVPLIAEVYSLVARATDICSEALGFEPERRRHFALFLLFLLFLGTVFGEKINTFFCLELYDALNSLSPRCTFLAVKE